MAGLGWYPYSRLKPATLFRTLIHPSSGACDFYIASPHWSCVLVSMCVGVSVWLVGVVSVWQAVSDINTSIIRSLQLLYCITTLVMCSCFDVCWSFGLAGLGWYPCSRLKPATHIETRTHNQCGDTIEKSQAPDNGCINVQNMLSIEEVK